MLCAGKVPPDILKSSVYPYMGQLRKEVLVHSGFGEDSSIIDFGDKVAVVSTDPITCADIHSGHLAVYVSCNDVAACGAKPIGILITLLLPVGSDESILKKLMSGIHEASKKIGIEVLGGHSEITPSVVRPVISATAIGIADKDKYVTSSGARPGDDIIVTKFLGLEGSAILASDFEDYLNGKLSEEAIKTAQGFLEKISVIDEGVIAAEVGVSAMHDITEGGLLGACYEVAHASGVGVEVYQDLLPLLPETREICRVFGIDPLGLISSGSMLICTPRAEEVVEALKSNNIPAIVIGKVTSGGNYIVTQEGKRPLLPLERDELIRATEKVQKP